MVDARRGLRDIRVVELASGMAGELAGMILAQYGADVVKVEPPGGGRSRRADGFRLWNEGKRCLELDLAGGDGAARFRRLVAEADALILALRPETVRALGWEDPLAASGNPTLICCSISGFDPGSAYGDLPGYEGLVGAKLGRATVFEDLLDRPGAVYPFVPVGAYGAAQAALQGILTALRRRARGGGGVHLRASLARAANIYDQTNWLTEQVPERRPPRPAIDEHGRKTKGSGNQAIVAATRDGSWVYFSNFAPHLFRRFIRCIGLEHLYSDPEFAGFPALAPPLEMKARDQILHAVRQKTLAEWHAILDADGNVGYEVLRLPAEVAQHPQVKYNQHLLRSRDGGWGLAAPWTVDGKRPDSAGPAPAEPGPDPAAWPARPQEPASAARSDGPAAPAGVAGLMHDVTVLELAGYWAGPLAARVLADYGARVIKVEPLVGDPMRGPTGEGNAFIGCSFGKESVAIDLKSPFGRESLVRLITQADVLLHAYRPGVPETLGFGVEEALRINPMLVYLAAYSFGSSGPSVGQPAYDSSSAAITAVCSRQGGGCLPPDPATTMGMSAAEVIEYARRLALTNAAICDISGALMVATAITYGLLTRQRTGKGLALETTMIGAGLYVNSQILDPRAPSDPRLACEGFGLSPLYRLYRAGRGWVFLACGNEAEWRALHAAFLEADGPRLSDFDTAWGDQELNARIEQAFAPYDPDDLERRCRAAGAPCVAVPASRGEAVNQPWTSEAGLMVPTEDSLVGSYSRYAALLFHDGEAVAARGVPALGEHTAAVLGELGFSEAKIAAARDAGAIRCWSP